MNNHFEEALAAVIADFVSKYPYFQRDRWFGVSCAIRRNADDTANVCDMIVSEMLDWKKA